MKLGNQLNLEDYRDKHGHHNLVIEIDHNVVKTELILTDEEALEIYKYIGQNFNVEDLE